MAYRLNVVREDITARCRARNYFISYEEASSWAQEFEQEHGPHVDMSRAMFDYETLLIDFLFVKLYQKDHGS